MTNKIRPDDNTTEWLDEFVRFRIKNHGQNQQSSYNQQTNNLQYLNGIRMLPGETPEKILEAKKYAENTYMKIPHAIGPLYAPGIKMLKDGADANALKKLSNYVTVNVDLDDLTNKIGTTILQKYGEGETQEAILNKLPPQTRAIVAKKMEQLQKGEWITPNTLLSQGMTWQNTPKICKLIPGLPVFELIQVNGFGSKKPLVRTRGQITPQLSSVDFIIKEIVEALVIFPNETRIDLSLLENDPRRKLQLVVIQAPPMTNLPLLLVPKEAIANGMGGGRQIITDQKQKQLTFNQQYLHQNQQMQTRPNQQLVNSNYQSMITGKTLLKG
jgi:hypothetical protein